MEKRRSFREAQEGQGRSGLSIQCGRRDGWLQDLCERRGDRTCRRLHLGANWSGGGHSSRFYGKVTAVTNMIIGSLEVGDAILNQHFVDKLMLRLCSEKRRQHCAFALRKGCEDEG